MGFKLPDLNTIKKDEAKKTDTSSTVSSNSDKADLKDPNINDDSLHGLDKTDSSHVDTDNITNDKLKEGISLEPDSDLPPDLKQDETDFDKIEDPETYPEDDKDFERIEDTNNSDDSTDKEPNNSFSFEDPSKLHNIKGFVKDIQFNPDQILLLVSSDEQGNHEFYLKHSVTDSRIDKILQTVTKNSMIEVQYNSEDTEETDDGTSIYTITDLINVSSLDDNNRQPEYSDEPVNNSNTQKSNHLIKKLINLNNKIGDNIYSFLSVFGNFMIRIPLIGRFLGLTRTFWRLICRLWLVVSILLIMLFVGKGALAHPSNSYTVTSGDINLIISNPVYNRETGTITVNVKNNGSNYSYYYLTSIATKKGFIPFAKTRVKCDGPSVGQAPGNSKKVKFYCSMPKLEKVSSYSFDIHNNN